VEWTTHESLIHARASGSHQSKVELWQDVSRWVKDSATPRTTAPTARIPTDKNQPGYRGADPPTETLEGLICSPNIFRFDRKSGVAAVKIQIPESISL
jgi:hypothetical protein